MEDSKKPSTFGEKFCELFCSKTQNQREGLITIKLSRIQECLREDEIASCPETVDRIKIDRSTMTLTIRTRLKFLEAIRQCKNNIPRVYILLNQLLKREAIAILFPIIYDKKLEVENRKANSTKMNAENRLHNECSRITRNGSVRKFAHMSII